MQIMRGKRRSGHGTKRPFDSDVRRMSIPLSGTYVALTLTAKWMVARVLEDDADLLRRGIERRLCRIAGTVGQCAELHRVMTATFPSSE